MIEIKISDQNYHVSKLDNDDRQFIIKMQSSLFKKHPELYKYLNEVIDEAELTVNANFIFNIITAFLYSLKDNEFNDKNELIEKVFSYFNLYFKLIVENTKECVFSHYVQYEPKNVILIYFANKVTREFACNFNENECKNKYDLYRTIEVINLFRTLKASISLFCIGDDVHAVALFRGFVELWCNIKYSNDFKDSYVRFKDYNNELQINKFNKQPLSKEMKKELGIYVRNENYIKYGWVLNKKNRPINTMKEFVSLAFENDQNIETLLHVSSEFVHEDYVMVNYDFVVLRHDYLNYFLILVFKLVESLEDEVEELKPYKTLFSGLL